MDFPSETILIAYVASPHDGYLKLFKKYEGGTLYILGQELIQEFPSLTRHLPGIKPDDARTMIVSLGIFASVEIIDSDRLIEIRGADSIIMPDEDVSRALATRYLSDSIVTFDSSWKLRWDLKATTHHLEPEGEVSISSSELDAMIMHTAALAAERSPDWWRQVGGVLARDGEILLVAYNTHLPSEQSAYICGDPRSNFNAGESIDMSLALHAEIGLLTAAARKGIVTEGCDMYVTTFPCPPCANACANSGIRRLFYRDGYSLVAGADSLHSRGVELIRVEK